MPNPAPVTIVIPNILKTAPQTAVDVTWDQNDITYSFYSQKYLDENNMEVPPNEWENLGLTHNVMMGGDTITVSQIVAYFEQIHPTVIVEYSV